MENQSVGKRALYAWLILRMCVCGAGAAAVVAAGWLIVYVGARFPLAKLSVVLAGYTSIAVSVLAGVAIAVICITKHINTAAGKGDPRAKAISHLWFFRETSGDIAGVVTVILAAALAGVAANWLLVSCDHSYRGDLVLTEDLVLTAIEAPTATAMTVQDVLRRDDPSHNFGTVNTDNVSKMPVVDLYLNNGYCLKFERSLPRGRVEINNGSGCLWPLTNHVRVTLPAAARASDIKAG